jgi:CheY-like chemotaxis protein
MTHKLLLADDSVTIQRVIELTFADEDVHVSVVGNGKQAIEKIQADRPDIVLADIGMPERDGYDVAAFVKASPQFAHIPVVLLTGAFEPIDETRARQVGCDGVLVKPFEPQMVINRVKELLAAPRPAPPRPAAPAPAPAAPPPAVAAAPQPRSPVEIDSDLAPPPREQKPAGDSLEDYFDRLDAAFANLGAVPPKPVLEPEDLGASLLELDEPPPERSPAGAADAITGWDPDIAGDLAPARQPDLANAFAALLAAEQGTPLPAGAGLAAPTVIAEETIEEIVRRVVDRMGDDAMRRLVVETAERVVREEIDRIKRG